MLVTQIEFGFLISSIHCITNVVFMANLRETQLDNITKLLPLLRLYTGNDISISAKDIVPIKVNKPYKHPIICLSKYAIIP